MTSQGDAMKTPCREIQRRLADRGADALLDDPLALDHVESCDGCAAVLEGLYELDELLVGLPSLDAPDAVVDSLMRRPELLVLPEPAPKPSPLGQVLSRWGQALQGAWRGAGRWRHPAWMAVAGLLVVTVSWRLNQPSQRFVMQEVRFQGDSGAVEADDFVVGMEPWGGVEEQASTADEAASEPSPEELEGLVALGYLGGGPAVDGESRQDVAVPQSSLPSPKDSNRDATVKGKKAPKPPPPPPPPALAKIRQPLPPPPSDRAPAQEEVAAVEESIVVTGELVSELASSEVGTTYDRDTLSKLDRMHFSGSLDMQDSADEASVDEKLRGRLRIESGEVPAEVVASYADLVAEYGGGADDLAKNDERHNTKAEKEARKDGALLHSMGHEAARRTAQAFLETWSQTDEVAFQEAAGYWRNTYLPGDPRLRHLAAKLDAEVSPLQGRDGAPFRLHQLARQPSQPFDPPDNAALAVYLHADRTALDGRQRLLLQVGLKGTERHSGRRGSMQVAVVLDLTEMPSRDSAQAMSALLSALAKARDLGDRFRFFIAGPRGGEALTVEDFRHGPLSLELAQRLETLERDLQGGEKGFVGLEDAYQQALLASSGDDDPDAPLGSSLVLLVTPNRLADLERLPSMAHIAAVGGVVTSVVGVGEGIDLEGLDRVALAGQGHRRLLHGPAEAAGLVDRELAAVGRVIARALRLRIRLAPGVHLVDVLESERLDTKAAQRVRDAEQSIDQRLARNLGITADRGDDEEGLQIVIPTFYAGDSHVVLLDVVADGAGPLADVQLRYKDLVHLENGVTRARLDLPRGQGKTPGPLERNVLENLLASRLRGVLEKAAEAISGDEPSLAVALLSEHEMLLRGLGETIPGWLSDADIRRDLRMLVGYRTLLVTSLDDEAIEYLEDSLRFSGYLKTLPRPAAVEPEE